MFDDRVSCNPLYCQCTACTRVTCLGMERRQVDSHWLHLCLEIVTDARASTHLSVNFTLVAACDL
jgi:hypothetical protein